MTHYLGPLLRGLFQPKPTGMLQDESDPVGDAVRAAVAEHERVSAEAAHRRHDTADAIEELLRKMDAHG